MPNDTTPQPDNDDAIAEVVKTTTAAQQVPEYLEDPGVLADIARVLGDEHERTAPAPKRRRRRPTGA